ncbi:SDR family NAD(P)-dependent oxidoreductase [Cumulibacter manganitolerans]|uniref:SDR family NAD(P)-dependent oxidoreductase n=1 Tax=Cumulibacter manganitolerans TaxID=1884992 RepID=UPI0012953A1C|nr:SDR family oxidoreductase [Cumulibacter manganitolerans]
MSAKRVAVVTGASSGIGAATARALSHQGFHVVCAARRMDRLAELADEIDGEAVELDVTSTASVQALAGRLARVDVLVNNAGGALGTELVADARDEDWETMLATNVLGVMRMSRALLPALEASGNGTIVTVTSTAGVGVYEGGGGYTAAKHGAHAVVGTLRLELCGKPVRVIEVLPGMVQTAEFSLNRLRGDQQKADAVYAGVDQPLVAEDVADAIAWTISRPPHVNIDQLVIRPIAQASNYKVARNGSVGGRA